MNEQTSEEERAYATDFEARYLANESTQMSEQVHTFLHVPPVDVYVEQVPKKCRTEKSTVPVR